MFSYYFLFYIEIDRIYLVGIKENTKQKFQNLIQSFFIPYQSYDCYTLDPIFFNRMICVLKFSTFKSSKLAENMKGKSSY